MIITGLDGKQTKWKILTKKASNRPKSGLHLSARTLLRLIYPTLDILEEVTVPIRQGQKVFLDFYLPLYKIAVEVHGRQHYEFVSHFHNNHYEFMLACKRDNEKKEWCELNNIQLVELPYNEDINEWRKRIEYS